jgi:hypothetical protein
VYTAAQWSRRRKRRTESDEGGRDEEEKQTWGQKREGKARK